jgi:hypothetical protein
MKWCILLKLSAYPIEKKETNIITYMAPHNFERCVEMGIKMAKLHKILDVCLADDMDIRTLQYYIATTLVA